MCIKMNKSFIFLSSLFMSPLFDSSVCLVSSVVMAPLVYTELRSSLQCDWVTCQSASCLCQLMP